MRRTILVMGILGFGVGSLLALSDLNPLFQRRDKHREFQELASSATVQSELAKLKSATKFRAKSNTTGESRIVFWSGERPPTGEDVEKIVTNGYAVRAGQIQAVGLNHEGDLFFLRKQTGETVYDAIAPTASEYWFLAIFPVLGFLTPCGHPKDRLMNGCWVLTLSAVNGRETDSALHRPQRFILDPVKSVQ